MPTVEVPPIPLSQLTTLGTGGFPERLMEARTRAELTTVLREVWASGDDWLVLGGGSNLFVGDEPFEGTVVRILTTGIQAVPSPRAGYARLVVEAGHSWDALVAHTVREGLAGMEAMSGIPGTVGASPVQNIGAYGQEIADSLVEVELLDEATGEVEVVPATDLGLGFRTSVLKRHYGSVPERSAVILSVTFDLARVGPAARPVPGSQLRGALRLAVDEAVTLEGIRDRVLGIRAGKGMVLDAGDPDTNSAGSFFQNAVVTAAFARTLPPECPRWPMGPEVDQTVVIPLDRFDGNIPRVPTPEPDLKISAAWLIEHAGLGKGFGLPRSRAALSSKHALALTNRGGASAAELAQLARFIQGRVQSEFGLILQPEPVLVGVEL